MLVVSYLAQLKDTVHVSYGQVCGRNADIFGNESNAKGTHEPIYRVL